MENSGCKTQRVRRKMLDPETEYLELKNGNVDVTIDNEWELFKENVRPLKRGRNVKLLNEGLKSHSSIQLKNSLLQTRRKLIEAIDEYKGDDPLKPWLECMKWVQEAFPAGGETSGLILIYEQCLRALWNDDRYTNDLRFLKVWLEYAENCDDAEVIFRFLEANKIGLGHSAYYIAYAHHLESKNKIKTASDIYSSGLSTKAQPTERLEAAYRKFMARSMRRSHETVPEDNSTEDHPFRSFGTNLSRDGSGRQEVHRSNLIKKNTKGEGGQRVPLSIYKDTSVKNQPIDQGRFSKDSRKWDCFPGGAKDRNKENNAVPSKWISYQVPQRTRQRTATAASIDVFVDDDCSRSCQPERSAQKSSACQLKDDEGALKRETKLLRQNPLRNFPGTSLPR